jgi:hypothetical protein
MDLHADDSNLYRKGRRIIETCPHRRLEAAPGGVRATVLLRGTVQPMPKLDVAEDAGHDTEIVAAATRTPAHRAHTVSQVVGHRTQGRPHSRIPGRLQSGVGAGKG